MARNRKIERVQVETAARIVTAFSGSNYLDSATDVDAAFDALDTQVKANADDLADYTLTTDLASTASGKGASLIGVEDAGGLLYAANVEDALSELANDVSNAGTMRTIEWDFTYADLDSIGASLTGTVDFSEYPRASNGETVLACGLKAGTGFAGPSLTSLELNFQVAGSDFGFAAKEVKEFESGATDAISAFGTTPEHAYDGVSTTIKLYVSATGCNVEDLTAGAATAWVVVG